MESNWSRAVRTYEQSRPLAIPAVRGCESCGSLSELVDVTREGTARYECSNRHETRVDVSFAMGLR